MCIGGRMETPTPHDALKAVRAKFRSDPDMAAAFNVSQPTVWRWINQIKRLPPQYVLTAEALTGVSRHLLRPDIYPVETSHAPFAWQGVDHGLSSVSFQNGSVLHRGEDLGAAA